MLKNEMSDVDIVEHLLIVESGREDDARRAFLSVVEGATDERFDAAVEEARRRTDLAENSPDTTTPQRQYVVIGDMLAAASTYGLETEVVTAFAAAIQAGRTIEEAATIALSEWDI